MVFNGFAMSEVQKNKEKPSRGEVVAGLPAHTPHDTQIGPILIPKWFQIWSQNDIRNCVKIEPNFGMLLEAKRSPKMKPTWSQNCSQVWAGAILGPPEAMLGPLEAILGHLGASLGHLWDHFGASLGPCWCLFGTILGPL